MISTDYHHRIQRWCNCACNWCITHFPIWINYYTIFVLQDIQKFIDKWEDGFVYFSFGTHLKLPSLPQGHQDAIFQAIRKFPKIGFVMKWNGGEVPKNIPDNVLPAEWLSQQDILAHPKIRAFITHGGLLSIQESVYHGVPMIAFPTFAEQDYNAERIHGAGRGIRMEIADLTEEKMENAIREILTNKKFENAIHEYK